MSRSIDDALPLSAAQLGVWTGQQLEPTAVRYTTGEHLALRGQVDTAALVTALRDTLREADTLHVRIEETPRGVVQRPARERALEVSFADLRDAGAPAQQSQATLRAQLESGIGLRDQPLARAGVLRLEDELHHVYLIAHHIALDGHGFALVWRRVAQRYRARLANERLAEGFGDYAAVIDDDLRYLRSPQCAADARFFQARMTGAPLPALLGSTAAVDDRPALRHILALDEATRHAMARTAARTGGSLVDVVLAAVAAFVQRQTGERDVTLGLPLHNRAGLALHVPAMLMNIVALRLNGADRAPDTLIAEVHEELAAVRPHGRYRYEQLRRDLRRVGGDKRLFGPVANLMPFQARVDFGTCGAYPQALAAGPVEDVAVNLRRLAQGELALVLEANARGHDAHGVRRLADALSLVLDEFQHAPRAGFTRAAGAPSVAAQSAPPAAVLLHGEPLQTPATDVMLCIAAQAQRAPHHPALVQGESTLGYASLLAAVAELAQRLSALAGASAGDDGIVAVLLPNGSDAVIALLGALHAGLAYLPLDPRGPRERLRAILGQAKPRVIVTTDPVKRELSELVQSRWLTLEPSSRTSRSSSDGLSPRTRTPPRQVSRNALAYVIYTSGSTGRPNGVMIERGALAHFTAAARQVYAVSQEDRVLQFMALQFDGSVEEIFVTLCAGATLVAREGEGPPSIAQLLTQCQRERVSVLDLPTAVFHELAYALAHTSVQLPPALHTVIIGGEPAQRSHVESFCASTRARVRLLNTYGPTEATVVATWAELSAQDPAGDQVPIGRPLPGVTAAVIGSNRGEGELYLLGPGLARGYLGEDALTRKRFVPLATAEGTARAYRTGDRVRLERRARQPTLVFLGRVDEALKISGQRVDPLEVEAALLSVKGVREAAAVAFTSPSGERRLSGHVAGDGISVQALRAHCQSRLLAAAVPAVFHILPALPRTASGKLDRRALAHAAAHAKSTAKAQGQTPMQQLVLEVWREVLGREVPSLDADFFELGGQSLQSIQVATRLGARLGREVAAVELFRNPTAAALAQTLQVGGEASEPSAELAQMVRDSVLPVDVTPADGPPVRDAHRIFLTGATGFVGVHVLHALLRETNAVVTCLVRAGSNDEALGRLEDALRRHELRPEPLPGWPGRVHALAGALEQPRFGLDPEAFCALGASVDAIIHCGASVSLLRNYTSLAGSNVHGSLEVLRLACAGRPSAVLHVSTVAVGTAQATGEPLAEAFVASPEGLRDGYSQTKWVAERLMAQAHERGLPVTVLRLGRVTAPAHGGFVNAGDILFRILKAGLEAGCLPDLPIREPWSPVDFAATAIVRLVSSARRAMPVVHCAQPELVALRDVFGWVVAHGYAAHLVSPDAFQAALRARQDSDTRATLAFLEMQGIGAVAGPAELAIERGNLAASLGRRLPACVSIERAAFTHYLDRAVQQGLLPAPAKRPPADRRFVPFPEAAARRYREAGLWQGISLWELLVSRARSRGAALALVDRLNRIGYAQLVERASRLAERFVRLRIKPGHAVIVQLPNGVPLLEVYFALFRLGARPIAAQLGHRRHELIHFARATGAVAHVHGGRQQGFDYGALFRDVAASCPDLRHNLVIGEDGELRVPPGDAGAHSQPVELPAPPAASEIALFQLSGGSTDVPKLIARTHDDYLYSVRRSVEVCGFDENTVYLAALPVPHNFTLSSPGVLGVLCAGGKAVLAAQPSPDEAFDLIERERVSVTALVPALVPSWLAAASRKRRRLASLRLLQVGGAKLHEPLARRAVAELGCRLQQVFGMAEGLVCYTPPDAPLDEVVACQGRPMSPYDEVRVVDEQDRDVEQGAVGHLLARGPYTIAGYYNAGAHNTEVFTADGFYRTGDLVRRLPCGSLVVEGRQKDQINRAGEKIAAPEVEAALCAHPSIALAALVGVPDPHLGERSLACIVASHPLTIAQVHRHLRAFGLAEHKLPDRIELRASLPKTPVGKLDKRTLRREAAARAEAELATPAPQRDASATGGKSIPRIAPYPLPTVHELPESRVRWAPEPARAVLLVHDMQRHFLSYFDGAAEPLQPALEHMRRLHSACRQRGVRVVFSAQPGRVDRAQRGLLNDMWGPGLSARPELAELTPELSPGPDDVTVHKHRYSAFFGTELAELFSRWKRDQLWICGVYAHIGCLATACDAFMRDIKPFLIADALADFGREQHDIALRQVASTCGVVTHTRALLDALGCDETVPAPSPAEIWPLVQAELARLLRLTAEELSEDAGLRELGMDSVRLLELLDRLQDHGIELDPLDVMTCETLAALRALCSARR